MRSLEEEIRNVVARIEMDEVEGGPSPDDMERLTILLNRWEDRYHGWLPIGIRRKGEEEALFEVTGKA